MIEPPEGATGGESGGLVPVPTASRPVAVRDPGKRNAAQAQAAERRKMVSLGREPQVQGNQLIKSPRRGRQIFSPGRNPQVCVYQLWNIAQMASAVTR